MYSNQKLSSLYPCNKYFHLMKKNIYLEILISFVHFLYVNSTG